MMVDGVPSLFTLIRKVSVPRCVRRLPVVLFGRGVCFVMVLSRVLRAVGWVCSFSRGWEGALVAVDVLLATNQTRDDDVYRAAMCWVLLGAFSNPA